MLNFPKLVVLQLLRGYKYAISPLFPPACRYVPSCAEYAMEAVERYGALRGGMMALLRLLRCHPFAKGGHDPVVKQVWGREAVSSFVSSEAKPGQQLTVGCEHPHLLRNH